MKKWQAEENIRLMLTDWLIVDWYVITIRPPQSKYE